MFSYESIKKINDIWSLKFSIPIDHPGIDSFEIKKWQLVNAYFQYDKHNVICVFSGFLSEPTISNRKIDIFAYDLIWYAKYRILRSTLNYPNTPIKTIISGLYTHLSSFKALPFVLWINDIDDTISIELKKNTSLYDCLTQIYAKKKNMQFRIIHKKVNDERVNEFDCSIDTWKTIEWSRRDNQILPQRDTRILERSRKDSFDDFCNRLVSNNWSVDTEIQDNESIEVDWLFEKYEYAPDGSTTTLNNRFVWIPTLSIDTDKEEWRNIQCWDKIPVSLISGLNWFAFDHDSIVQETKITANSWWSINFTAKAWPNLIKDTNILNKTLEKFGDLINKLIK